jgi:hypothetical protein
MSVPRRTAYIKPTRRVHDSGYRIFECGYHTTDDDVQVLGTCSDHIRSYEELMLNMDLTRKGYIRIWSNKGDLEWDAWIGSTATLRLVQRPSND